MYIVSPVAIPFKDATGYSRTPLVSLTTEEGDAQAHIVKEGSCVTLWILDPTILQDVKAPVFRVTSHMVREAIEVLRYLPREVLSWRSIKLDPRDRIAMRLKMGSDDTDVRFQLASSLYWSLSINERSLLEQVSKADHPVWVGDIADTSDKDRLCVLGLLVPVVYLGDSGHFCLSVVGGLVLKAGVTR